MNGITGTFNNTTAGMAKMSWNGIDAGFLKQKAALRFDRENLDFEVDTPSQFVGRIVTRFSMTLSAMLAEVTAQAFAMASGLGATGIASIVSGVVSMGESTYDLSIVTGTTKGWRAPFHGTVSSLTVKNPAGSTTYVSGADYTLVAGGPNEYGGFNIITGSALDTAYGSNPSAKVTWSLDPGTLDRIRPGQTFTFETQKVIVTHIRPHTGKFIRATIPKMMAQGKYGMEFSEGQWQLNEFVATAIPDSTYYDHTGALCPYGFVDFQK